MSETCPKAYAGENKRGYLSVLFIIVSIWMDNAECSQSLVLRNQEIRRAIKGFFMTVHLNMIEIA